MLKMPSNSDLYRIYDYYGINHQLFKLAEECSELAQASIKLGLGRQEKPLIDNFIEEIADVLVLIEQMQLALDIKDENVENIIYKKISRQLDRMYKGE